MLCNLTNGAEKKFVEKKEKVEIFLDGLYFGGF
jgi:hypothetical protein